MSVRQAVGLSELDVIDAAKLYFSAKKILIVENNYLQRVAHLGIFRVMGYKNNIIFANDGAEAFSLSVKHDLAMVFISVGLSDINDMELYRKIREESFEKRNRVFVIGMSSSENFKQDCLDAGADAFILKPLTIKSVTAMFNTLLQNYCYKKTTRS